MNELLSLKKESLNQKILGFSLLFFYALCLSFDRGVSIGWTPLLLVSVYLCVIKFQIVTDLNFDEKIFILALAAIPLSVMISMLVHGDSDLGKLDNYLRFLLVIPIFLILRHFKPSILLAMVGISFAAVIAGIIAIYEVFILNEKLATGFFHKIHFGGFAILFALLNLVFLVSLETRDKTLKAVLVLGVGMGFLASILSLARGPLLAVPVVLLILVLLRVKTGVKIKKSYLLILSIIFLVLPLSLLNRDLVNKFEVAIENTKGYMEQDKKVRGSAGTRFEMWKAAVLIFKKHPIFGVGMENYETYKNKLVKKGKISAKVKKYGHPHSDYLRILSEQGLFGFSVFFGVMAFLAFYFFRMLGRDTLSATGGLVVLVCFLVFGVTEAFFRYQSSLVVFLILIVMFASALNSKADEPNPSMTEDLI